jgi:opacity protein-like surface antigen
LLLAGGVAAAHDDAYDHEDFARTGAYLGGGFTGAFNETDLEGDLKDSVGVDGRVGYRFHPHFAVEADLTYLHDLGDHVSDAQLQFETLTGTGNLKAFILTGRVQPYVVAGVGGSWAHTIEKAGGVRNSVSNAVFTYRGGAGVDFYVDDDWLIYTEATYVGFTGQFDNGGMVPLVLGAQYRF